jgi:hypothetical protein
MERGLMRSQELKRGRKTMNLLLNNKRIYYGIIILIITLLSFWSCYSQIFNDSLWVQVKFSAPGIEVVRAYWNDPQTHPDDYESILVKPRESQKWDLKIEALGEKNSNSDGFEVAVLGININEEQLNWSQGEFAGNWEFRNDPSAPEGKVAISHSNKPEYGKHPDKIQSLSIATKGKDLQVILLAHSGAGKVRITANGITRYRDLYSSYIQHKAVTFQGFSPGDKTTRSYLIQIPDTLWGKIQFVPEGEGIVKVEQAITSQGLLTINDRDRYVLPSHLTNRLLLSIFTTLLLVVAVAITSIIFFQEAIIILGFTSLQGLWMLFFTSPQVSILNTLPTFIFLSTWYLFIKTEYSRKQKWIFFCLGFLLTLRLPLTLWRPLELFNWIIFAVAIAFIFKKIIQYYRSKKKMWLLLTTLIIIWFNTFTHISQDSPYTYVNRASTSYFECPHEGNYLFMVNCDNGHFLATELIFTEPNYKQDSVLFRRFFYGYLNSLIGFDGHRMIGNLALNLIFWLFACTALYNICDRLDLGSRIASTAMLCCASSWGFVSFVGQPAMYLAAYAYAAIIIWATIKILQAKSKDTIVLCSTIVISSALVYDLYAIALASFMILLICKKFKAAFSILIPQIFLSLLWKEFYLRKVFGTIGDQSNSQFAVESINTWINILKTFDFEQGFYWFIRGTHSFIYGNLIFGAFASFILIIFLGYKWIWRSKKQETILLLVSLLVTFWVLLATIVTIPQASQWGLGIMLPRLAFYAYPIGTIALAYCGSRWLRNKVYIIPLTTFLIANLDLSGLASVAVFFDYGAIGIYWK